ncbi:MAG: FAD-binding oxidoreductase, partial [Chloroflexota bacterium]|nr:FAD-binding oxidoreductase [Chloroflexota bacterium]
MTDLTVVVIGAGALGASTAYHLARRGARVTLVDQYAPGSQTSPRAAGLTNTKPVSQPIMVRLQDEATETLAAFERECGRSIDFVRSGSVKASYTDAGERRLLQDVETARAQGVKVNLISAAEAERLAPWFVAGPARTIAHVPSDGYLDPARLPVAYIGLAQEAGARVLPFTRVTDLLRSGDGVEGVATTRGELRADVVVDAAGA